MTDFGRRSGDGDMLKSVYDPDEDGVIATAQTQADMVAAVYDPVIAAIQALLNAHNSRHESGGADEIDATGLTGVPIAPLLVDGTAGRHLRMSYFFAQDGTNASTLKCRMTSRFNGDTIGITDNIAKGATTGDFYLSADGKQLRINNSGLTGNVLQAAGILYQNYTGTDYWCQIWKSPDGIELYNLSVLGGAGQDWTTVVDAGNLNFDLIYITDA